MTALAVETCERCGWDAAQGQCRREVDSGDSCAVYAFTTATASPWGPPVGEPTELAPTIRRADPLVTVWRKPFPKPKVGGPARAHIARYVNPNPSPQFRQWTADELAAMGQAEHSPEWQAWYKAMPARMTAKQERAYFLKGGAS